MIPAKYPFLDYSKILHGLYFIYRRKGEFEIIGICVRMCVHYVFLYVRVVVPAYIYACKEPYYVDKLITFGQIENDFNISSEKIFQVINHLSIISRCIYACRSISNTFQLNHAYLEYTCVKYCSRVFRLLVKLCFLFTEDSRSGFE